MTGRGDRGYAPRFRLGRHSRRVVVPTGIAEHFTKHGFFCVEPVGGLLARQLTPQNFRNVPLQSREIKLARHVMKPTNTYERELVRLGDMLKQET